MEQRMRRTRIVMRTAAGLAAAGAIAAAGCNKTPLTTDGQRSQFDHYDQTRNDFAQPYVMDEFGMRRPNLSARLLQKD